MEKRFKKGRKSKELHKYTYISYYGKLKEPTEVMEYRYPPFDRGERD
jgi:hypothetical protein